MKDSGIEWIGEIPEEWEVKKVKDLFSFGKGLSITKENLIESGISVISYGQIHSKDNNGTNIIPSLIRFVSDKYLKKNKKSLVNENDFIFADTSEDIEGCGNCVFIDKKMQLFAGYHTIILKALNEESKKYLAYLFKTDNWRSQIRSKVYGVKVYSITQKIIKESKIIFPPLREQQLIADFLDDKVGQIDGILSDLNKQIDILNKYKKSLITETVTKGLDSNVKMKDSGIDWIGEIPENWKIKKLKYSVFTIKGYAFDSSLYSDKGVLLVRASDMKNNTLVNSGIFIDDKVALKYNNVSLKANDIIISTVGSRPEVVNSAVGQISIVSKEFAGTLLNQNTVIIRPSKIKNKFLFYYLLCHAFREYMNLYAHGTVNQASLSLIDILDYYITIPPLEEQQQIADYLDKKCQEIDSAISDKQKQIEIMEKLKKSLIYEYVTGKKRVGGELKCQEISLESEKTFSSIL